MRSLISNFHKSFSEAMSSTFKSRSKLFEFYKHTHPDVLTTAPERIKEENLRSLKILNSYLDNLSQNKGVQEQRLKFYIADKANRKAKKYYFFDVNLSSLKENVPSDLLTKHLDGCVNTLLQNLKTTKIQTDPKLREQYLKEEEEKKEELDSEQIFEREGQYTMKPIGKKSTLFDDSVKNLIESQYVNATVFNSVHKQRLQSLVDTINDKLFYFERENVKPLLWTKILFENDEKNDEVYSILNNLIDPRMIFLDKELSYDEIKNFQNILVPKEDKSIMEKRVKLMKKWFSDMETCNPQIFLYVSKEYSASKVPGCLTIPYNFKYIEASQFYYENKDTIIEIRDNYKDLIQRIEKLKKKISENQKSLKFSLPKSTNPECLDSVLLALKQIVKFMENNKIAPIESIEISSNNNKVEFIDTKLILPLKFPTNSLNIIVKNS